MESVKETPKKSVLYDKSQKKWLKIENQSAYKYAMDLVRILNTVQSKMNRQYKYGLGRDLARSAVEVCKALRKAWRKVDDRVQQKLELENAISCCEEVVILIQACDDVRCIARTHYVDAVNNAYKMLEQVIAWHNKVKSTVISQNMTEQALS